MGKIINFEEFKNKLNKKYDPDQNRDILFAVIKYIYIHMEEKPENVFEEIHLEKNLEELFNGDRNRFAAAFVDVVKFLEIAPLNKEDIPMDEEFERFTTVYDLCAFFDSKLGKKNK